MTRQRNNTNYFPELSLTALKIHIETMVRDPNHHFNHLIERVSLYHSAQRQNYRYVLVVETTPVDDLSPEYREDLLSLRSHWEPGIPRWLFGLDFKEVYRNYPPDNTDFNEWHVWEQSIDMSFPEGLVNPGYRWVLFERLGTRKLRHRRNYLAHSKVREFVADLFAKNPNLTTAEAIRSPHVDEILNEYGIELTQGRRDKTLREWTQDLRPNYSPRKVPKSKDQPDPFSSQSNHH